jgi:hypothetical protein
MIRLPGRQPALRDDERRFVDLKTSPIFVGAEIGIISSGIP